MYSVDIVNKGGFGFDIHSEGYEFKIAPKGKGINASATFLASLGACIGVYIRKYVNDTKIELKEFNIKVEAEFKKEPRYHFQEIKVFIDLKGLELDEQRKKALLNFTKNCPVHNTLGSSPQVNISIV